MSEVITKQFAADACVECVLAQTDCYIETFSIQAIDAQPGLLTVGSALALACGTPPMQGGGLASKTQLGILELIAEEMADGFRTGIERIPPRNLELSGSHPTSENCQSALKRS